MNIADLRVVPKLVNNKRRFIVTDKNGEILDNAQGYGYRKKSAAVNFLQTKYRNYYPQNGVSTEPTHSKCQKFNLKQPVISSNYQKIDFNKIRLTKEQKRAVELIKNGKNIFLTGAAGTGKSLLLKYLINEFDGNNTRVCAPTGLAAIHINGTTIHRLLHLSIQEDTLHNSPVVMPKSLEGVTRVIIDEISMVRSDLFAWLTKCLRLAEKINNRKIQLIVVGDFYQLPPIIQNGYEKRFFKPGTEYCFNSRAWKSWHFEPVILHKIIRQSEPNFINALNKIRIGDFSGIHYFNEHSADSELPHAITLTGRNDTAAEINRKKLDSIQHHIHVFKGRIEGRITKSDEPVAEEIYLKKGAQVIAMKNGEHYRNGSIGVVTGFVKRDNKNCVKVRFNSNGLDQIVEPNTWTVFDYLKVQPTDNNLENPTSKKQKSLYKKVPIGYYTQIPLRLGYAITIHKSQGQTYKRVNVQPAGWCDGLLYVCLSRVGSIENMYLSSNLNSNMVRASPFVNAFYNTIENNYSIDLE